MKYIDDMIISTFSKILNNSSKIYDKKYIFDLRDKKNHN